MSLAVFEVLAAGVIVGLVQVAKESGMTGRYASLLSVVLGIVAAIGFKAGDVLTDAWPLVVLAGIIAGLSAAGLYSGQKALRE